MLDAHQWGTPVHEYTDADEMLADIAARKSRLAALRYEPPRPIITPPKVEQPPPAPRPVHRCEDRDWLDIASPKPPKRAAYRDILDVVSHRTGVSIVDLLSERRTERVTLPRQIACWLLKRHTSMSLPQIGRRIGNRDHTTIIHACRKIEGMIAAEDSFKIMIGLLSDEVMARIKP